MPAAVLISQATMPHVIDTAERILSPLVYQRDGRIVEPRDHAGRWVVAELSARRVQEILARACEWRISTGDGTKAVYPPARLAETLLARVWPGLRELRRVTTSPYLTLAGRVSRPGYDAEARTIYVEPAELRGLADEVEGQADEEGHTPPGLAAEAWSLLSDPWREFPFRTAEERAIPASFALSIVARPAIAGAVPIHAVSAAARGSGKSFCLEISTMVALGEWAEPTPMPPDEVELAKAWIGIALESRGYTMLDNIELPRQLGGESLNLTVTSCVARGRILGESRNVSIPMTNVVAANGNNLTIAGDTERRCLYGRIEQKVERPEDRTDYARSEEELRAHVRKDRHVLLWAALTVLRARSAPGTFGGFGAWTRVVRGPLLAASGLDLLKTRVSVSDRPDPDRARLAAFLEHMANHVIDGGFTARDVAGLERGSEGWQIAAQIAAAKDGSIDAGRLGRWLSSHEGRRVEGLFIERKPALRGGAQVWGIGSDVGEDPAEKWERA